MANASKSSVNVQEDDIGSADAAASLGADGGPLPATGAAEFAPDFSEDLPAHADQTLPNDSWLGEELSDEELAALSEEDFGEDFLDEDLLDESLLEENIDTDEFGGIITDHASPLQTVSKSTIQNRRTTEPTRYGSDDVAANKDELDDAPRVSPRSENDGVMASDNTTTMVGEELGDYGENAEIEAYAAEDSYLPVPRISIHAFCETPETTALLEQAAIDRRLAKTHLTMHMGGVTKAVDHFQTASTPNLIILEAAGRGEELLEKLSGLAEVCDPSTKVIIVGRVNDIALYRALIREGISDYVVNPKTPLQIIKSIASLYVDPSAPPIGKTLAFVGARGGVGSSTIAHNVAWCAAELLESDTVILDLDLPFGTASLDFEQDPTSGLLEALASPERLDDVLLDRLLQKHTDRLSLFTAPNLLDRDYDLDDQAFETVVDVVRGAAPTIVIDVPHLWTNWSKRILQTADEIVITTTPDLAAFRNTKNLIDVISSARPNDSEPTLIVNQFDAKTSSVQPDQYTEHVGLEPSEVFGWEPQLFHTAATNAAPIIEVGEKTKTAQSLIALSEHLLGRRQTLSNKNSFDIMKFFRK
ncbi:MAG: pilus assembly protein CpaE [Pseudomonadota bacterium]